MGKEIHELIIHRPILRVFSGIFLLEAGFFHPAVKFYILDVKSPFSGATRVNGKLVFRYIFIMLCVASIGTGCISQQSETPEIGLSPRDLTGIADLDHIVPMIVNGRVEEQKSLIEFSEMGCTFAEGLGSPPKCEVGEEEGTSVEVLPFLGPEGHFIRKDDIETWEGLSATGLFAAYEVSDKVYSDENYPAGDYALVFLDGRSPGTMITLQVKDGRIVRIDYRFGDPPTINQVDVAKFLVVPPYSVP